MQEKQFLSCVHFNEIGWRRAMGIAEMKMRQIAAPPSFSTGVQKIGLDVGKSPSHKER
jgi:hypothetical protein